MSQPVAYLNGEFLPLDQLLVKPQDMGFMLGVTVAEQLRTFRGELFDWPGHEARLRRSLEILGVSVPLSEIESAARQLVESNYSLLRSGGDLGLTIFVTPGIYPTYAGTDAPRPTVGMHTYELPFQQWASLYEQGQRCRFVSVPQVSSACWPRELKCRSRFHYYLADREARSVDPASRAILLDQGYVNEASTANVVAYRKGEGLVSPRRETILQGVSLQFVEVLAAELGIDFCYRDLPPDELLNADEVLLTSTPFCLAPVSQLDEQDFEDRTICQRLLAAWSEHVGMDIVAQACE